MDIIKWLAHVKILIDANMIEEIIRLETPNECIIGHQEEPIVGSNHFLGEIFQHVEGFEVSSQVMDRNDLHSFGEVFHVIVDEEQQTIDVML